jgi:hypothetical protein
MVIGVTISDEEVVPDVIDENVRTVVVVDVVDNGEQ